MKRNIVFTALSLVFSLNAMAAEPATAPNRDLVVAITESGTVAADTAWMLSNQTRDGADVPILLVVSDQNRNQLMAHLQLRTEDLPALVYLDARGNELQRVVNIAPASKVFKQSAAL